MQVRLRPLVAEDRPAAERINRAAFGKFFGVDPLGFRPGADVIGPRWRAWPEAGLALELDGALAAVALMMDWGSVCILGPITVDPEHWDKGLARRLMPSLIELVDRKPFSFTGLFTHPQSPKHIRLYESFGFSMQRITAVMAKPVAPAAGPLDSVVLSSLGTPARESAIASVRELTDQVFPGLDLGREIRTVAALNIGETIVLEEQDRAAAIAICHHGARSEASEGQLFIKFAAARGGDGGGACFLRLLEECERLAAARGAARLIAGTNCGRANAYRLMQDCGYRTIMNGVAMMRPAAEGYNTADKFVIDDWR
jgi:GNAT superfamily N-acetyltransferase